MPKLSVIVPFHNVQEYASDTLRSLARNAGKHTEFLLVDDCSTDATGEILDAWQDRLPNARLIRHEQNRGIAQARNTGIAEARGDHLTFLDGDDWYAPGHLDALVAEMERIDCDFLRTDHVQSTGTKRVIRRPMAPRRGVPLNPRDVIAPPDAETMVDYPFVWAGVYRTSLFQDPQLRFAVNLRTAEDRLFIWRLHLAARTVAATDLLGVFYRRGVTTSLTQIGDDRQLDFLPAYDTLLDEVTADREADRFLPKLVRTYCAMIAFHAAHSGRYEDAVARELQRRSTEALHRMPQDVLRDTLAALDAERAHVLRRLHRGERATPRIRPARTGRKAA
ncbi:glycosyltransferase family 2 protein [Streptomyces sp. JJ36]|uniref:glycosyltransferase family 2 protein n=1 Tax=Streptomyces sp. JJ36 TaxID=2736645 RepID=UPI001F39B691|nr:glycosyltransferase family 2 protein [Streptomyces sp. JJ36]MCF6525483.1 glycosyltransferase family 2 protein [Streptomyces sp. JJ36]